jgi:hypothetical protein
LASGPEGRWPERASGPEGKGRQGGIFKALKYYQIPNKFQTPISNDQNDFVWDFEFLSLDSYLVKSEDFLLTSYAPSPFPSPRWGEGGGEGKISNIFG